MWILPRREIKILRRLLKRYEHIMHWPDARFYTVQAELSLWSPAQQLYHSGLVVMGCMDHIGKLYQNESPEILRDGKGLTGPGFAVMTFGMIPRGRAKSPPSVEAPPEVTRREVRAALLAARQKLEETNDRIPWLYDAKGRLPHPMLGNLNALQWLKFTRVHTAHHIRIAEEIGAAWMKQQSAK